MDHELIFSIAGMLSLFGWVTLLISPLLPRRPNVCLADWIAGRIVPVALAVCYVAIVLLSQVEEGGFRTFAEVTTLFSNPGALLAGWIHFLAFDLIVGAWICRTAREEGIGFLWVLPCLPFTFLFGPAGFLMFVMIQGVHRLRAR